MRNFKLIGALFSTLLMTGCAVSAPDVTETDRALRVDADLSVMFEGQEELTAPLSFNQAVARGLKYNLDKRLKLMERTFAEARSQSATYEMLPSLVAKAGYDRRDRFNSSTSLNVASGVRTTAFTTSADRGKGSADLRLVWNFLDFGVSWVGAKQEVQRARVVEERRIKVVQNLIVDIRDAFWRASAAQNLLPRVSQLINRVESAIAQSKRSVADGTADPAKELKLQLALLNHTAKLQDVRRKLALSKVELGALINLPPGTQYEVRKSGKALRAPRIKAEMVTLYQAALENRPELRQEDYEKVISELELDKTKLRMLPGLEINISSNYDSNSFLADSVWSSVGAIVSKNLIQWVRGPSEIKYAKTNIEVADARRRALSMAVITQVHISTIRYALAQGAFKIRNRTFHTADKLSRVLTNSVDGDEVSPIEALEAESKRTVALIEYYAAYADLQNAYGRILNSVGAHRFPEDVEAMSVSDLADWLDGRIDSWRPVVDGIEVDGETYGAPKVIALNPRARPERT
ncbi:MAG: TolC family protein [Pseudomonadota bacterium]